MADRDMDVADQLLGWWLPVDAMPDTQRRWLRNAIAAALAARGEEAKRDENEACAQVAGEYAARMTKAVKRLSKRGRPTLVATCKEDAGTDIAAAVRARMQKETT
jgi:hypothetical protein